MSLLNKLISYSKHIVYSSKWLKEQGYSLSHQKAYRDSGWLQSIGSGAMKRKDVDIDYLGAVYTLQNQLHLKIYPGGRTALELLGKAHYLPFSTSRKIFLFGEVGEHLPKWFKNYDWGHTIHYQTTGFLPHKLGRT